MKTKLLAFSLLMLFSLIGIVSCDDDDDPVPSNTITFQVTIDGANEVPPNGSTATGTATFTYNKTTYALSGTVNYSGITAANAHIHKGAIGVSGGVVIPLGSAPFTSPLTLASTVLDSTQRADLLANLYYVNIHSTAFPAGEIRGQLIKP